MFYSYNSFTGRLTGTGHLKAYSPQGFQKLGASEPVNPYPASWAASSQKQAVGQPVSRSASTTVPRSAAGTSHDGIKYAPVSEKLKRLQEHFQKPNNVLVHLRGGPADKVLYYATAGLCTIGVAYVLQIVYTLAYPRKPAE